MSLERQVRIAAGAIVVVGAVLASEGRAREPQDLQGKLYWKRNFTKMKVEKRTRMEEDAPPTMNETDLTSEETKDGRQEAVESYVEAWQNEEAERYLTGMAKVALHLNAILQKVEEECGGQPMSSDEKVEIAHLLTKGALTQKVISDLEKLSDEDDSIPPLIKRWKNEYERKKRFLEV